MEGDIIKRRFGLFGSHIIAVKRWKYDTKSSELVWSFGEHGSEILLDKSEPNTCPEEMSVSSIMYQYPVTLCSGSQYTDE